MFDVSFPELMVIAVVALLVLGPERLPTALRTLGLWLGRLRRSFLAVKTEVEREIGMDEVRRQLHNESIMEDLKRIEREVKAPLAPAATAVTTPTAPAVTTTVEKVAEEKVAEGAHIQENGHDGIPEASRQS
jgi:sec-independent protein translocase protein TatB